MNNRNFIINMVINGEKQPAFSAKTLNLPPVQTDLTPQIIANTRTRYSRAREDIEQDITNRIAPSTDVKPPASNAAKQAAATTVMAPAIAEMPAAPIAPTTTSPAPVTAVATPEAAPAAPAKKKRTRSRRKKSSTTPAPAEKSTSQPTAPEPKPKKTTAPDETIIKLR